MQGETMQKTRTWRIWGKGRLFSIAEVTGGAARNEAGEEEAR